MESAPAKRCSCASLPATSPGQQHCLFLCLTRCLLFTHTVPQTQWALSWDHQWPDMQQVRVGILGAHADVRKGAGDLAGELDVWGCRWSTSEAPSGPDSQLAQGWAALGMLLLQIVAVHRSTIPEGPAQEALDGALSEALQMLSQRQPASNR